MSDSPENENSEALPKKGIAFAFVSLALSLVAPLILLAAIMATSVGYIDYNLGFNTIALNYVPKIGTVAAILAVLSLLISLFRAPRRYGLWALAGVLISGALLAGYGMFERRLKTNPPIHDVSTNWERPVTFSAKLIERRGPDANPIEDDPFVGRDVSYEWAGQSIASINAQTCPGAVSIQGKPKTADQVAQILKEEGYIVFGRSDWRVEAMWEDPFWGVKSDVVVRLDPDRTDVRSVSREELSDLGGNCQRVLKILKRIKGN